MVFRFERERKNIEMRYDQMERDLIEEFVRAQERDDFNRMKDIAHVLSNFKGYSQCIDAYIEFSQRASTIFKFHIIVRSYFLEYSRCYNTILFLQLYYYFCW